jgi:hypothetical protein
MLIESKTLVNCPELDCLCEIIICKHLNRLEGYHGFQQLIGWPSNWEGLSIGNNFTRYISPLPWKGEPLEAFGKLYKNWRIEFSHRSGWNDDNNPYIYYLPMSYGDKTGFTDKARKLITSALETIAYDDVVSAMKTAYDVLTEQTPATLERMAYEQISDITKNTNDALKTFKNNYKIGVAA